MVFFCTGKKSSSLCPKEKPEISLRLRFFWLWLQVVLVLELFNTSTTVDELLLSCKERMTCWANVKSQFFFCWSGNKRISTCASYFTFLIIRMDSFLHASYLFPVLYSQPLSTILDIYLLLTVCSPYNISWLFVEIKWFLLYSQSFLHKNIKSDFKSILKLFRHFIL